MIQNKVSVRRAIHMAARTLEIEQMGPIMSDFIEWVWEGELKIGSSVTFTRKECTIDIVNYKGCLPKDVMYILGIGKTGFQMERSTADFQMFSKNIVVNGGGYAMATQHSARQFIDSLYGFYANTPMKFSISNGFIHMSGLENGNIGISYKGVCMDEEGYPLVNELHTDALAAYLIYMHTQREYLRQRVPEHTYKNMQGRWFDLCVQARSEDEAPNPMDLRILNGLWNNMLALPDLNNF